MLLWKDKVRVTVIFKSGQMITVSILLERKEEVFFCTFVYTSNFMEERRELWTDLKNHQDSPLIRHKTWMICGDFNEILEEGEHSNFTGVSTGMREFQDIVRYCSIQDMGYQGPLFTWCNKREERDICKKLDRVLINEEWVVRFPHAYSVFEAGACSDHMQARITLESATSTSQKPFKFSNILTSMPGSLSEVERSWESTAPLFHSTSSLYRFSKKLKALRPVL